MVLNRVWSEIGSGFGESGGTPQPGIEPVERSFFITYLLVANKLFPQGNQKLAFKNLYFLTGILPYSYVFLRVAIFAISKKKKTKFNTREKHCTKFNTISYNKTISILNVLS